MHNVKSFLGLSRFENEEYSLCFALWGTVVCIFIVPFCELGHSRMVFFECFADSLCRFALWSIVRRLQRVHVLVRKVKSFLGLSRFENEEYSLCFAL